VSLSNVAQKVMDQPDFDRSKVEAIKQAIKDGNYPINPRRIAESFVALEKMITN
jgi:negative regulator of flagellin synthesis FlgM